MRDHGIGRRLQFGPALFWFPARVHIGDYTDFYSSREHATNVGTMFRGVGELERRKVIQPGVQVIKYNL